MLVAHHKERGLRVVRFDGYSQMHSSTDFAPMLSEYTILSVARYLGGRNERVISSIGSNWAFGFGSEKTGHWTAGSEITDSAQGDAKWHLHAGTMTSGALATLRRDRIALVTNKTGANPTAYKPTLLALGGSNANDQFSQCEVAEVLIFDRVLTPTEITSMETYLHDKWFGGSTSNFPLLVRMGTDKIAGFDYASFADQANAGDLRFINPIFHQPEHKPSFGIALKNKD